VDKELRRLLEHAGILRRGTPDHLLQEGDDDPFGGGDDDDEGGDDPFGGDDDAGDDAGEEGGEEEGGEGKEGPGANRIPPEDLTARDVERFGSPTFSEVESKLQGFFNQSVTSASVGAQELETYPGQAIIPDDEDQTPALDNEEKEEEADESADDEDEEKNESFSSRRDKELILEAMRLLNEAENEGAAADEFDMENFARMVADYMENIHNTMDVEGGIFNGARQMVLNNFGQETENEFCQMLAAIDPKWDFKGEHTDIDPQIPVAVGASAEATGA
jgi:hypothetical protein